MTGKKDIDIYFVNSFRGSGIGDFGWKLKNELEKKNNVIYYEITPTWKGLIHLWRNMIGIKSQFIFNLGFTSFGKSNYRNFMNFLFLKFFAMIKPGQTLILHDSIDTAHLENSGYSYSWIIPLAGTVATKMLNNYKIFVFSKRFYNVLERKYRFRDIHHFPFPAEMKICFQYYKQDKEPLLLNVGYIAPYKGLELLPEIKARLNNVKTVIVGDFYKNLLLTSDGGKYKMKITDLMENHSIMLTGHLDDNNLIALIKSHRTIAVLPYISGYNASYAAILFVTLGIPVVATNIDVFEECYENGAGILLSERTPDAFANAIQKILDSPKLAIELIEKDLRYCSNYSLEAFNDFILLKQSM